VLEFIYSHGPYSQRALGLHLAAPLLQERERFLQHLQPEGATQRTLRRVEQGLIKTIRCFRLKNLRDVELREVHRACARWKSRHHAGWTPDFFWTAKRWLRFHRRLRLPAQPPQPYAAKIAQFTHFLTNCGLSSETIRCQRLMATLFLRWLSEQHRGLRSASLNEVDKFFSIKKATKGWSPGTIATAAAALRSFFQYAENCYWCSPGTAIGIKGPHIPRYRNTRHPPAWREVRQLLAIPAASRAEIRANAILSLFTRYGLRASGVIRLRLADLNWKAKTLNEEQ
jgi:integrase/recombinase XerD